ncbi:hypothetical protein ACFV27_01040 [Streptomyces antimycoticus]|uniref:hypothetical protein n=1 Tax=Streptomyces antimycoticus TaxID=68175 RepID=UPI0036CC8C91
MAKKTFALNSEPHIATVGGTDLEFLPEVMGDEFMDAFAELREAQQAAKGLDMNDLSTLDPAALRGAARGMRAFLARLMLPESATAFTRLNVVRGDQVLGSFQDWDQAQEAADAAEGGGARVVWAMPLPDRVLVELLEWVVELYGGGADERPPTSSSASAPRSPKGGRRGMGVSPSRASTPAPGR